MLRKRVAVLSVVVALGALLLLAYGSAAGAQEPGEEEGPPVVVSNDPFDRESRLDRDTFVFVRFSEEMREESIVGKPGRQSKTVRLYEGNKLVPAEVRYFTIGRFMDYEARLEPNKRLLKPKTEYTVVVEGAADDDGKAVKDAEGTPMEADYTFSFTTGKR